MDPRIDQYLRANRERHLAELEAYLRIPSVSTLPEHRPDMLKAAEWTAAQLKAVGATGVQIMQTPGHPVVYGEWLGAPGAPTVLVYGHYDVQPPDPLSKWDSPPFQPTYREGRLYARGVSDDKGPLFIALKAAEALMAVDGRLPINLKYLFEGEEEIGSPSLAPFIRQHAQLLKADLVVSADGAMWRASEPSITTGGRGMAKIDLAVYTARTDLHSGRYGGAVPNALHALAELIAGLHHADGGVAVAGFYDRVQPIAEAERRQWAALPFDEEGYRRELELEALFGEAGYSTLERMWARPTLEVNGMWGGFQGEGSKTVIPCEAHAKITCRLVADQDPSEIQELVRAHLLAHAPAGCRVEVRLLPGSAPAYQMPAELPALAAAGDVLTEVMGQPAVFVRMGGTLPAAEIFQTVLHAYTLFFSFSAADEQYHAPNEFFRLDRFDAGIRSWAALWRRLAGER